MKNKNNIFSFSPTGSPQGSEARKKKKKTPWISEYMQKEGPI
uniref:Alternative protein IGF1 n=1 Tax=Homo sapiens TaxID=9606 RepID=L8E8N9_HUMAN|nr:alternative protein IGF1 [Homo sapiens]